MSEESLPNVFWRPRALFDLQSIVVYLGYEKGSPQAAKHVHDGIVAAIERVRLFPEIGKKVAIEELRNEGYRQVPAGSYIVFYRYVDAAIVVYRVLHQRQDVDTYDLVSLNG